MKEYPEDQTALRNELRQIINADGPKISKRLFSIIDQLREHGGIESARAIVEAFGIQDQGFVLHIGHALFLLKDDGKRAVLEALERGYPLTRGIFEWLMYFGDESIIDYVRPFLKSKVSQLRDLAMETLVHIGVNWEDVLPGLQDEYSLMRRTTAKALGPRREGTIIYSGYQWTDPRPEISYPPEPKTLPGWSPIVGVGNWEAAPILEQALSKETDKDVLIELRTSYILLIWQMCPDEQIEDYACKSVELYLAECERPKFMTSGFSLPEHLNIRFDDYLAFCKRGGLSIEEPFLVTLTRAGEEKHMPFLKGILEVNKEVSGIIPIQNRNKMLCQVVIRYLVSQRSDSGIQMLIKASLDAYYGSWLFEQCEQAILSLGELSIPNLIARLGHAGARRMLQGLGAVAVEPLLALVNAQTTSDNKVRAIEILVQIGDPRAKKTLERIKGFWSKEPKQVKVAAGNALDAIAK